MKDYFMRTERIGFSQWTADDLPLAVQLWGSEDVTRYLCAGGKFSEQDIRNRLSLEIHNQQQFCVQYWPIFELSTETLIGCCGLRPFKAGENAFEHGFHLRKIFWGRGYRSEAAAAAINYGFSKIEATKLYAGHHPENANSKKLLLRLGFQYISDHFYEPTGLYHPWYEISSPSEQIP